MGVSQTTFIAVLGIGALLLVLSTTGYLNNASSLSNVVLFAVLILGFALYYDFVNMKTPVYLPQTTFKETVTTTP